MKVKLNNYNLAKGALVQMQRKQTYATLSPPMSESVLMDNLKAGTSQFVLWWI